MPCRGADKDATSALNEMPLTKPRSLRAFAPVQSSLETLSHTSPACRKHHRSSDDPGSSASLLVLKHIRYAHRQQDMGLILIGRSVRPTSHLLLGPLKKSPLLILRMFLVTLGSFSCSSESSQTLECTEIWIPISHIGLCSESKRCLFIMLCVHLSSRLIISHTDPSIQRQAKFRKRFAQILRTGPVESQLSVWIRGDSSKSFRASKGAELSVQHSCWQFEGHQPIHTTLLAFSY